MFGLCAGLVVPHGAFARPAYTTHSAASAPTMRTFYVSGSLLSSNGTPSLLVGLANVSVDGTGAYSGTMTMGGTNPITATVTGIISSTMTLSGMIGGQQMSVMARPVKERIGNPISSGPATTTGMEFQGDAEVNSTPLGYVTAIDTSILQNYSFAATVSKGTNAGMDINGSLYALSDHRGDLHGYFQDDATGAVYPLLSGTLWRGQLLIHVNLLGHGDMLGAASVSRSILNHTLIYKGTLFGPALNDTGTWYCAPTS
jgi:hypothetical protein